MQLDGGLDDRLARSLDVEEKIPRALDALGPLVDRDVVLLGEPPSRRAGQLEALGARVSVVRESDDAPTFDAADGSADVVVGMWDSFRGAAQAEIAEAERVARPGGRLLVVHDYGRDDVSLLRGDRPEYGNWSRRGGPFLGNGFRLRVIHCFWTFESLEDGMDFLTAAFGDVGRRVAASMKRPRLSYNVAIYHRTLGTGRMRSPAVGGTEAVTGALGAGR